MTTLTQLPIERREKISQMSGRKNTFVQKRNSKLCIKYYVCLFCFYGYNFFFWQTTNIHKNTIISRYQKYPLFFKYFCYCKVKYRTYV